MLKKLIVSILNRTDTYLLVNKGLIKATKLGSLKVSSSELDRFIN